MRLAGEPVSVGEVALMWATAAHRGAIGETPWRDVAGVTGRLLVQLGADHHMPNVAAALSRLDAAGASLVISPHPSHLLALTRPYVLGELGREAWIVCVRAGAELRVPILTSDLLRARALAQRCNARARRPLPWTEPFPTERAHGAGGRRERERVGDRVILATDLEQRVHDCLQGQQHLSETLRNAPASARAAA